MPFSTTKGPNNLPIVPLWINGTEKATDKDFLFPVISSVQDKPIHYAVSATPASAIAAVEIAAEAFKTWRTTSPSHRRTILLKAADILAQRGAEIAGSQIAETSCPQPFADFNIRTGCIYVREMAAATSELRGTVPQRPTAPDGQEMDGLTIVVREPIGVVLIIPPWNGAVILPLRAISMALAAGCAIVVKASELCPRTHSLLVEAFEEAGVPNGVLNIIQARREDAAPVVEAIISHKAVRKVDFIGSAAVGSKIGQVCAKYLKPVLMELGGKGPAIVCEDADLKKAAGFCAMGGKYSDQNGKSTADALKLFSTTDNFVSRPSEFTSTTGDAVTRQSAKHAYDVLQDAEAKGAKFLCGGLEYLSETSLKPTLVTNVSPSARIWDEETFGPSASVYTFEDDEEAIAQANDSSYGLNAAVHSQSWEHAYKIASKLEFGQVHINNLTSNDAPNQPIQGVKGSGWGQSNSIYGIREFTVEKTIMFHSGAINMFDSH